MTSEADSTDAVCWLASPDPQHGCADDSIIAAVRV